ncbi:hypothetical protein [Maribacter flavus]|uniref:Uncharacterized protein n=1 Tax=Maribacter flavus TaxID=1658664 RepID=A0A5B2TWQ6_9FLAO|nr:hypothetical protein [Maribacter flavus]KAA2218812.1 hypothetical protein F0361_04080 [Maribacter flavus]
MGFAFIILTASAIFCLLILSFLALSKNKFLTAILLVMAGLFLAAASFYAFTEYLAYKERKERYTVQANEVFEQIDKERLLSETEFGAFKHFKEYRNAMHGYEVFFLDVGINDTDYVSYQNTIRDEIMAGLESQQYGETYWNTILNIAFDYDKNNREYHRPYYGSLYVVPAIYEYHGLEENYGDLNDAENYAFFERMSQLLYMGQKIKSFDRSAENIGNLWNHNKSYIYTFFSKKKYDELCKEVVDDLLEVHETLTATPNYRTFYAEYDISDEGFLDFPSLEYTSSFDYSWPFSFWDRRFSENNAGEVYAVLKEIQDHYKD